jgi:hypothetical protein
MNQRELKAVKIEADRRCDASQLREILAQTPIIIARTKGSKLRARMGLGKIIYIQPMRGQIRDVKLGPDVQEDPARTDQGHSVFTYQGKTFDVQYRYNPAHSSTN